MTPLQIRHAAAADAATLTRRMADWFVAAYGHASDAANTAAFVAANFSPARQAAEIADPDVVTLLAEIGGSLVGYTQLRFATRAPDSVTGADPAELGRFYFAPALHGRGVAAELLQAAFRAAHERGRRRLWLLVWQEAPQAIRFYEKHGFAKVGTAVFLVGEDRKADWVMCKPLDSP
ncbi:GNAT family N-acetyltransferase [Tahibacter caeni]|uniref:GNAT family N-acetyltransferase n=1 Tax=Tahibacter caeni TaxID=1453545 RepID=UPI0021491B61|nr:GNAT family N-acetyltransferase [Tahibacter caeni]